MAETSAQLKRKRESAAGLQKKAKKQRKSDATAAGAEEDVVAAEVAEPTQGPKAIPQTQDKTKKASRKAQANGAPDQDAAVPSSTKPIKDAEAQQNGGPDKSNSSKQSKKQRKQDQKDSKNEQLNGDGPVEGLGAQAMPTPTKSPIQDPAAPAKKSFKERVAESKEAAKAEVAEVQSSAPAKKHKQKAPGKWAVSQVQGGWFLPTDPVFSQDEKCLLLANPKGVQIYAADTSLLSHFLAASNTGVVTAYALSSTNPSHVYVADSNCLISLWDWVAGTKIARWDIGATVRNMVVITQPGTDEDLVYCHETGDKHVVNVHALRTKSQASKTELKHVLKTDSAITSIQVLLQGKYVIISTADSITVGKRLKVSKTAVQEFEYVWRELKFSKRVTTCDTYFRQREVPENGKKSAQDQRDVLDLAVGDEIGVILLFEDILASFAALESVQKGNQSRTDSVESLRPKKLHWHRNAVGSVKWSLDGNYLISGGDETVLTIWQLATGKPQHLPHLTAAIESVVVSPTGSSYALSLANNSVIVISTTELEAKTNIVGVQTRRVDPEQLPKETKSGKPALYALQSVPIAVDPKHTQQVLFTVPASQPRQNISGVLPEPYLQTFDIANQRPVDRQALTRNNATDPNMGPDGERIKEPNVRHIQVSYDGQWLATVDEWLPPRADTAFLHEGNSEFTEEQRLLRREVYLKIWRRDEKNGQWTLETRIDAPHFLEDVCGNGRVLDLVAHPKEHIFATIGEDHIIRTWKPKTRLRDGIVVRGADNKGLVNWSLHRSITLPDPDKVWLAEATLEAEYNRTSRLAFSPDGSVLAAGVSGASESDRGLIHLVDTDNAAIRRSMTEIDATVLCGLGIVGRCLVVVTDCITVWDLVNDDMVYCASINTTGVDSVERTSVVRLATNEVDGTFALSLPHFEKNDNPSFRFKKASSKVFVYDTEHKDPLWSHTVPGITLGLTARKGQGERGYIALDSRSCIRTISPAAGSLALPLHQKSEEPEVQSMEIDAVEDVEEAEEGVTSKALADLVLENEYDKPVVTQQDLEEIFHNDGAPQAPKDVFSAVLRLFGGVATAAA
ncbi:hypothetical protein HBH53_133350 [Parastagonospora nodorum]|nr:hypothetical protein HBH53_133350 [Parastagonospora nodorum]